MVISELWAFFKALPAMVSVLQQIVNELKGLKQDAINKELDTIRNNVNSQILILSKASNDEDRKKALLSLALAISK